MELSNLERTYVFQAVEDKLFALYHKILECERIAEPSRGLKYHIQNLKEEQAALREVRNRLQVEIECSNINIQPAAPRHSSMKDELSNKVWSHMEEDCGKTIIAFKDGCELAIEYVEAYDDEDSRWVPKYTLHNPSGAATHQEGGY